MDRLPEDFRDDIPISKEILSHVEARPTASSETPSAIRFPNLFDFDPAKDALAYDKLDTLDRWALHQTAELTRSCTEAYDAYEFHRVYQLCNQFSSVTLSATYHDILKDRLYTLGTRNPLRRSSQTALHHILRTLLRILAPIVQFHNRRGLGLRERQCGVHQRLSPPAGLAPSALRMDQSGFGGRNGAPASDTLAGKRGDRAPSGGR